MRLEQDIVVVADHQVGDAGAETTGATVKLVSLARSLTSGEVIVACPDLTADLAAGLSADLAQAGASCLVVPDPATGFNARISAVVADFALSLMKSARVGTVLCVSNYRGREVTARLAVQLGTAGAVDVAEVSVDDNHLVATKMALSGSWTTKFQIDADAACLAIRPGVGPAAGTVEPTSDQAEVEVASFTLSPEAQAVTVVSATRDAGTGRVNLTEADVVVVGGRGVDGDFTLVESLADSLGGAVGATRVACDEGWVERAAQVGQTGVSVAPKLYVGLGVSGAVHHTCGMQASEKVVAVCDDPDAPIFELADFGIVGDVSEVVPQALERIAQVRGGLGS